MAVNLLFSTLLSLPVAYRLGRNFLAEGKPGSLLLGCGALFWGFAGLAGSVVGLRGVAVGGFDANLAATVHDTCVYVSALCHLAGVACAQRWDFSVRRPRPCLAAAYAASVVAVGFVACAASLGWLPIFFMQGTGGTPVRQFVLASAIALLALAVALLRSAQPPLSVFAQWYALALALIAAGLWGLLLQPSVGSLLGWTGWLAQYAGGAYLLAAALTAARGAGAPRRMLGRAHNEAWHRYGVAAALVLAAAGLRLVFLQALGTQVAFVTFYPAVMFAALYGGWRAVVLAAALAVALADYLWIEPVGTFAIAQPSAWLGIMVFLFSCAMISAITETMHRALAQAAAAVAEARFAAERERIATASRESGARLAAIVECSQDAIIGKDLDGAVTSWNRGAEMLFGYSAEEMLGHTFSCIVPPARIGEEMTVMARIRGGETVEHYETERRRKDGATIAVAITVSAVRDAAGNIIGVSKIARDITERKRMEQALRLSEQFKQGVLDSLPAHIAVLDDGGRIQAVNRPWLQFAEQNGDPETGLVAVGADYLEVCRRAAGDGDALAGQVSRGIEAVLRGEEARFELEYPCDSPTESRWFVMQAIKPSAEIGGAIVTHVDITARKQAENLLRASEERQRLVLEASLVGTFEIDLDTDEACWNAVEFELLGLKPDAASAGPESFFGFVHPDDLAALRGRWRQAIETGTLDEEFRIVRADGAERWLAARGRFVAGDADGRPARRFLGVNFDITERKHAEEALREASRRKDEFLAMLAHELRNPLMPIMIAADMLEKRGAEDAELVRWAGATVRHQGGHLKQLVDQLLDVSRVSRGKIALRLAVVDLREVVAHTVETARPQAKRHSHELLLESPAAPLWVQGDAVRLEQVVGNLLNNAVKYTPDGGRIEVGLSSAAGFAVIRVRDSGVGMAAAMLPSVFDLFAQAERTLDRAQGGLGIGLALVKSLAEMHGGRVEAHSAGAGLGSEFVVRLPLL
ncbi:MAG: PAS domain S-box protein, partial [Candidatus Methylumidiphilus sp.]